MRNKFEHFLLLLLWTTSVLLGLSFWLYTIFGFNLFCREHWSELAQLQASHTPIDENFYLSIIVAVLIFLICAYLIYKPNHKDIKIPSPEENALPVPTISMEKTDDSPIPIPNTPISRPPRLKLPSNMAEIATQRHLQNKSFYSSGAPKQENTYNKTFEKIFSDNGYTIKPNPVISGFTPNLFAIGTNEIVWIGAADIAPDKMEKIVNKLQSVFQETLEDIQINVNSFVLDTLNQYQQTDSVLVFKSVDELKAFIDTHPSDQITNENRDNFDAYSEYIDTIITYIKNV